jgi:hypothetical protein
MYIFCCVNYCCRCADWLLAAGRPYVTLTYAQSLDGSIATADKCPMALSGQLSMEMTHRYGLEFCCRGFMHHGQFFP